MAELGFATLESREGTIEGGSTVGNGTYRTEDNRNLGTDHNPMTAKYDPDKEEPEEGRTVVGPGSLMKLGGVGAVGLVIWWAATLTSDVNTIKSSLVKLDSITVIQTEVKALEARVDALERRGSEPMQALQKSVDKLSEELRIHVATTAKLFKTNEP